MLRRTNKALFLTATVFLAVFLFGLADSISTCNASVMIPKVDTAYQTKAKGIKLKISVKKKTKKSSIKLTGKTGAYFTVIISVNGQEKTTLTANKKGKFSARIPLEIGANSINIQASSVDGIQLKTATKIVTRIGEKTDQRYTYDDYFPIILSFSDNKGNISKSSEHNGYFCTKNCGSSANKLKC